jgi:lysophospholipase L1-like esterase
VLVGAVLALGGAQPSLAEDTPAVTSVSLVGDSLVSGREALYRDALRAVGVDSLVDGRGSRALRWGWQCKRPDGRLEVLRTPKSEKCRREGLELLRWWARQQTLGEGVVIALGTNDAGLYKPAQTKANLSEARKLVGERPIWLVTVRKLSGSPKVAAWNKAAREWCAVDVACEVIEWAESPAGQSRKSYSSDGVHLTEAGTRSRAMVIAAAVSS